MNKFIRIIFEFCAAKPVKKSSVITRQQNAEQDNLQKVRLARKALEAKRAARGEWPETQFFAQN